MTDLQRERLDQRKAFFKRAVALVSKLVQGTRDSIVAHVEKVRREAKEGKKPRFRTLKERTGLNFGSGTARKFRRRHAKRVLGMARRQERLRRLDVRF